MEAAAHLRYTRRSMRSLAVWMIAAAATVAPAAEKDAWTKVRELKSGTDLRILKREAKQLVEAKLDEAGEESLIVVIKNEQTAIPKDDIERIDFRPAGGSRVTSETKTSTSGPESRPASPSPDRRAGPQTNMSSGVSIGSKPAYETIYRRRAAPPKP